MALSRANRLRHRSEFDLVYKRGCRHQSKHLTVILLNHELRPAPLPHYPTTTEQLPGDSPTRVGISISKKVSKKAVVRNRIRRWLQAAIRHLIGRFPTGWDLVIVVSPTATQCDYVEFLRELKQLLAKTEVLHGHS